MNNQKTKSHVTADVKLQKSDDPFYTMNLTMLQIVADTFQASRDAFDAKHRKGGDHAGKLYEASLSPAKRDIEDWLVKADFLAPRSRTLSLPTPSTPPSSPSRWRRIIKPISPSSSKALLRRFKAFKKHAPVDSDETDEMSDTDTITPIPEPKMRRANSLPTKSQQGEEAHPEFSSPFPFHCIRNLKQGLEPRRTVRWALTDGTETSTQESKPTDTIKVVVIPERSSWETWSETLDKPIAEITYADIISTSPRLIQTRVRQELNTKKEIALAAAMAAQKARERTGEDVLSTFGSVDVGLILMTCFGYSFFFFLTVACALSRIADTLETGFSTAAPATSRRRVCREGVI